MGQVPVQFEQNILRDLLRQPAIARHAPRQRKDHRLVLAHELLEVRLPVQRLSHAPLLSYPQNFP